MGTAPVRVDASGPVVRIVLSRATKRNALTGAMVDMLTEALADIHESASRVVVWSHDGPVFSAGWDVRERLQSDGAESLGLARILELILHSPLPHVAELHGGAMGAGVAIVAACDIAIASSTASFALPEVRVGVVPALVLAPLRHRAGRRPLQPLALTGRPFSAEVALRVGLLHDVTAPSLVHPRVVEVVDSLLETAPGALAETKALLNQGVDVRAELMAAAAQSSDAFRSEEAREGLAAFVERRPARWADSSRP